MGGEGVSVIDHSKFDAFIDALADVKRAKFLGAEAQAEAKKVYEARKREWMEELRINGMRERVG